MNDKNSFILKCDCHCKIIEFLRVYDVEDNGDLYVLTFFLAESFPYISFWKRFKISLGFLFRIGNPQLYDIVITSEQLQDFKDWIKDI